nr:unnamed protein product [Digitaria exilis]
MAYRGGGRGGRAGGDRDRGDHRPPFGHSGGGGGGRSGSFVWPPPATTPRPVPAQYPVRPMGFRAPMVLPHQVAYEPSVAVYRAPAPAKPSVSFSPAPPAAQDTIRAPPPAPSSSAPSPRQLVALASSSAPSAAALANEVEKKLFVSETALAPSAAAASAAVAAAQGAPASDAEGAADVDLAPVSKKGLAHPARPGFGTVGSSVMIRANHVLVDVADNNLYHYDVFINPESKSRATNREVLNELIKLHGRTALGGKLPAYDGRKSLYTAGALPFESEEFVVTLVDSEEKERAEREYKITVPIAGRTDMYHLHQFLRGRQRDMPQETIQVLDVVLRESPSWKYINYISATSFFKPVTVIKFVEEFLNIRDSSWPLSNRDRVKIKKALRRVRIETRHQPDQIRRYKITGITPISTSQLIFPIDEMGTRQTVVQYFWDKYNYRLKYGSWPCLQAGRLVYLPMEVCKIVEGQRYSKKLNDRQVTNILRATCKRPQEREQSIRDMVLHNKYAEDKFAQEFGIRVNNDLVSVPARMLPPPMLRYHDSAREKTSAPSVGQWNMINKKMINGGTINNWTCLNFSRMRPEEIQMFCMDLTHMCNATGMGTGNQLQLLLVILPDVSGSYGKIKRICMKSIDLPEITKYRGLVSAQEITEDPFTVSKDPQKGHNVNGGIIRELLIAFRRKTNRRPERIIFYGDGVSEGQFSHVLLHEMDAIRKAYASLEEGYLPPVTFVVVQKRHHMRLFPEVHGRRDVTDESGNILPGTVVYFYFCSLAGIQQTSRPTHLHVLYDHNHFTADAVQSLTNNLCYKYSHCTHAVSVALQEIMEDLSVAPESSLGGVPKEQSSDCGPTPGKSQHRLRGGCSDTELVPLRKLVAKLIDEDNWLELITIDPDSQLLPAHKGVSEVVGLAEGARTVLRMLNDSLEWKHECGESFDGTFEVDDIWMVS